MDLPAVSYDDLVNLTMNRSTIKDEKDDKGQELDLIIVILTSLILGLMILTTVIVISFSRLKHGIQCTIPSVEVESCMLVCLMEV